MNRGKLAVVTIFCVALGMAIFAVMFQARQDRQLMRAWTAEQIDRIRRGEQVEAILVRPTETPPDGSGLEVDGTSLAIESRSDISDAPGLAHARHVLIQDSSYLWDSAGDKSCEIQWQFGFIFSDSGGTTTVLVDPDCQVVYLLERKQKLWATEMTRRLQKYLMEDLGVATDPDSSDHLEVPNGQGT